MNDLSDGYITGNGLFFVLLFLTVVNAFSFTGVYAQTVIWILSKYEVGQNMRRSKLEMYVDILSVLAHRGPLKLTHVMYKANVNCCVLKEYLDFLLKQGLVEERTVAKKRTVYFVTQHGITVLKYFKELRQVLPMVDAARNQAPIPY